MPVWLTDIMKIERIVSTRLPTPHGEFAIHGFRETEGGQEHVVLSMGDLTGSEPPLVRVIRPNRATEGTTASPRS